MATDRRRVHLIMTRATEDERKTPLLLRFTRVPSVVYRLR